MSQKKMSILEHIDELRSRLIKVFIVVVALTLLFFLFEIRLYKLGSLLIPYPFPNFFHSTAAGIIVYLSQQFLPSYVKIIVTNPSETIVAELSIALFLSVAVGMPVIAYEFWAYISPALYAKEKMLIFRLTAPAVALFAIGAAFGYIFIVPFSFDMLYMYAKEIGIVTYITINEFITFILMFCAAMGITFELPVIMWGVTKLGIVKPDNWKKYFSYFVAFSVVYGALITPDGSGITMWFVAIPMIILYGLGYVFSKKTVIYKGKE